MSYDYFFSFDSEADLILFVPEPPVIEFRNYKVGEVYEVCKW